jgi:L-asparaginase II
MRIPGKMSICGRLGFHRLVLIVGWSGTNPRSVAMERLILAWSAVPLPAMGDTEEDRSLMEGGNGRIVGIGAA